jgi:hypothetical protein
MNAFRVLVKKLLNKNAAPNALHAATNTAVVAIRAYQNKKAQAPNSVVAVATNVSQGNAAPTTQKSFMAGVVGKLSNMKTRLTAPRVKAAAMNVASAISIAIRLRRAPGVPSGTPPHVEFTKAENYFKTQPNSNTVQANKLKAGAKKRLIGGWNYGVNNSRKATFWKEYNALNKSIENMARTRNFTRYIPLGRNANKNIKKYPKYTQFFTNAKNLPGLNTRRNALLAQEGGILPNQMATFNKSVDDLLKQYNKYKGYYPVTKSYAQLAQYKGGVKGAYMTSANRAVFKGFANKGPEAYRKALPSPQNGRTMGRNVVSNRKAYGTDPEFKKFWNLYNKSEAALKLEAAKAAAVSAANLASAAPSVRMATTAAANAARAAAEARTHFNKTNRSAVLKSVRDAANAASKRAQASLAAAKKREADAAAKTAANAKATAAQKATANKAAANKTAKIAKLKKNISNARNAASRALQAVNAAKAEAEATKANLLKQQLAALGENVTVANQQVQEARGHANAAKKADAQKKFNAELKQFNSVKSYAKLGSLNAILGRMASAAKLAGISNTDPKLLTARKNKHEAAIREFIQEIWPMTERGGAPGNANVNRIAAKYEINLNADKALINNLIPKKNNLSKNSIIGWRRLRGPNSNYNERRNELRKSLKINTQAAPPPPPPPPPTGPTRRSTLLKIPRLKKIENNLRNRFITSKANYTNSKSYNGINKTSLQGLTPAEIKAHLNSLNNFSIRSQQAFNNAAREKMANYFK